MKRKREIWPERRVPCVTVLCLTAVLLQGCASASQGSFCAVYLPVYTDAGDTEETRRAADANNAVWLELCQRAS